MKRLAAAFLAMIIGGIASLGATLFVVFLKHGSINVNDPAIIKIASNVTMVVVLFAFFRAWHNPDSFFSFFTKTFLLFRFTSLNTPVKRLMLLVFIIGFLVSLITCTTYVLNDNSSIASSVEEFFEHVIFGDYDYHSYPLLFWIGLILMIIGLFGSLLFDRVLGKVFKWIKNGN